MADNNGRVTKERVRQLEDRMGTLEGDLKGFFTGYNDERIRGAEWRGRLDNTLDDLKDDLKELKTSIGRRKSDRVKLFATMITVGGLVVAEIIRVVFL